MKEDNLDKEILKYLKSINKYLYELNNKINEIEQDMKCKDYTIENMSLEKPHLDNLVFKLDNIEVKDLSGVLSIGNNFGIGVTKEMKKKDESKKEMKVKHKNDNKNEKKDKKEEKPDEKGDINIWDIKEKVKPIIYDWRGFESNSIKEVKNNKTSPSKNDSANNQPFINEKPKDT